jgi:pyranose oxidase
MDLKCWVPYSGEGVIEKDRPWHVQVHRAFSYGDTPLHVDNRVILDFRYFGKTRYTEENSVTFSDKYKDMYGMPQPTFHFKASEQDSKYNHEMMIEMTNAALNMGGFLPGSGPQFMPPGLALHITVSVSYYHKANNVL